jgi:ectoine hydroxylase-related dioxygenase (phytanoyl-CoA dioxygenase family)
MDQSTCSLDDFKQLVETRTRPDSVPLASDIISNIPVYAAGDVRSAHGDADRLNAFMAEWNRVFRDGAGIVVIRNAFDDPKLVDDVTAVLADIIAVEEKTQAGSGDHFAPAGANSRIWNAHEKLCMAAPELYARYNANPVIPLVSCAWLGPLYQITTQVNVVRPGGKAQTCHRDYHMGFQTAGQLAAYPAHVHALSAALTLQGAVAHSDMPVESGPTKLLPFSQKYLPGYIAALLPEFRAYFEDHHAQLPLEKGDTLFFNPAVFHAAGENRTADVQRFANLMQIGSGYGRSIEIVDRARMCRKLYTTLAGMKASGVLDADEIENVVTGTAEGYPFPANLDIDSPLTGMAPPSQQDLLRQALGEGWPEDRFLSELDAQLGRKRSH